MIQKIASLLILMLTPIFLFAHGGHGNGVVEGFTHPILGIDHLVAILGAGILGYFINPKKWYLQVGAFVIAMIIGGLLGIGNEATFLIEKIIAFSVFFIGGLIAFRLKPNVLLSLAILAAFGFFHGYAHGAEMSESNTALKYISGYSMGAFLAGTVGMVIGKLIDVKHSRVRNFNVIGGVILGCGVMMLLG